MEYEEEDDDIEEEEEIEEELPEIEEVEPREDRPRREGREDRGERGGEGGGRKRRRRRRGGRREEGDTDASTDQPAGEGETTDADVLVAVDEVPVADRDDADAMHANADMDTAVHGEPASEEDGEGRRRRGRRGRRGGRRNRSEDQQAETGAEGIADPVEADSDGVRS